jgi:ABC-type uncharacterized transport system ATPase subunit
VTPEDSAVAVDAPGLPGAPDILVRVEHVAKAFGATQALRDCSFELRAGEVHALAGENGSGKSTLVKILSGVHLPDSGRVEIAGATVQLRSPKVAQERGVVTVFQEVLVAETRTGWAPTARGGQRSPPARSAAWPGPPWRNCLASRSTYP